MIKKTNRYSLSIISFLKQSHGALLLFLEVILGIAVTTGSVFAFIKLRSEVLEKEFIPFDMQILHYFYSLRNPLLNTTMIDISYLGGEAMIAIGICIGIFLLIRKHRREAVLFAFIFGMAAMIDTILKDLVKRPRPQFHPLVVETGYSFPSGHAMDSIVFYLTVAYLSFHVSRNKKLSMLVLLCSLTLIFLIGVSRVYLGVHYPSDVLAGYIGGLGWFASVLLIQKTLVFLNLFKESNKK